jgi:GAF domain-containing protein
MIRFLLDENFNGKIVRGLRVRIPDLDVLRVQDTEMYGADNPDVLEWAATQGRVLLTHDLATMTRFANDRIALGLSYPGIIFVRSTLAVGLVIEDLAIIVGASEAEELTNRNIFLPL